MTCRYCELPTVPDIRQLELGLDDAAYPIPGYPGYHITRAGKVTSPTGRVLNGSWTDDGYLRTSLDRHSVYIHKLLALVFIPNPELKPMIIFKNGDRSDIRVENIEWATPSEHKLHGLELAKRRKARRPRR